MCLDSHCSFKFTALDKLEAALMSLNFRSEESLEESWFNDDNLRFGSVPFDASNRHTELEFLVSKLLSLLFSTDPLPLVTSFLMYCFRFIISALCLFVVELGK